MKCIDLEAIARCHAAAFPNSLATAMGIRYLQRMFSWYLSTDKTFLFYVEKDRRYLGYVGGIVVDGTLATGSASGMAQYSFNAAVRAVLLRPWLVFHPEVRAKWPLLQKNIMMRLGFLPKVHYTSEQKQAKKADPHVGLVIIAVHPDVQGKGYGSALLKEFERRSVEDYHIHKLQLTVLADNEKAIRTYERNGWQRGKIQGKSLVMYKIISH